MKRTSWQKVALLGAAFIFTFMGLVYVVAVRADLISPLTVDVTYPPTIVGPSRIGGSAVQQVFRLGSSTPTGLFAGLNPKTGTCPGSGTLQFLSGNTGSVGTNNFVYAMVVTNSMQSTLNLDVLLSGLCDLHTPITSVGYCDQPPIEHPTASLELATGLDYFYGIGHSLPPGQQGTVVFYTTPDPPARQPTSIGSSGIVSQGQQPDMPTNLAPIYGACRTNITIDKEIACVANGPFTNGPQAAINGAPIFYRITVRNDGTTPLDNVVISDPKLKAGGNLTGDFTFPMTSGHLDGGQMVQHVFGPFVATTGTPVVGTSVNGVNTATATADYLIPDQTGAPSGQTFNVNVNDSVTLNVIAPPSISCQTTVSPTSFASLPATLTYTLKATNTGPTDLSLVISDTKLKPIIDAPPAGITINSVAIHGGAGFAAGTLTGGNKLPANFAVVDKTGGTNTMAQVDVSLTVTTLVGFQALADGPTPPNSAKSTNQITVTGAVTNFTGCPGPNVNVSCLNTAMVNFAPSCSLTLTKLVACGPNPVDSDFGATINAFKGSALVYRYVVSNTGADSVNNVVITDNIVSSPLFNVGTLAPGETRTINVAATAPAVPGPLTNTASATGVCATTGSPSSTTNVNATVTVLDPQINCDKTVNGVKHLAGYTPGGTLTYTLTAGNAAASGLNVNLVVDDPTVRNLPGVSCRLSDNTPVTLPQTFSNVPPGQTRSISCTVSFATEAAFKAAAGGGTTLTNTMQVNGAVTAGQAVCAGGIVLPLLTCQSQASVSLATPPPNFCIITPPCVEPNCPPVGPGTPFPATSEASDQKAGSLLVYNLYSSDVTDPRRENTAINITNTGSNSIFVHMFFVDGVSCSIADNFLCLSTNQTARFLASDIDPGTVGYIIALAVDEQGCPMSWNYLIGDAYVKLASGHHANLAAEAFTALYRGSLPTCGNSNIATLNLDGIEYNRAPRTLALDSLGSLNDGNSPLLVLNSIGGDLGIGASGLGTIFGIAYNDVENSVSFSLTGGCQFRLAISNSFPRTIPRMNVFIGSGRTGWMKFQGDSNYGILGAAINFNSNVFGFNQGHNLHKITLNPSVSITVPVIVPSGG
ncbi:MAG: hypothetical protein JST85_09160 [Acidobacteria bacterium]|nr:hypothetical protein [Acidobacteriota bacterium]